MYEQKSYELKFELMKYFAFKLAIMLHAENENVKELCGIALI